MEKVQNNQNWATMISSDHFKPLWWEMIKEKNGKTKLGHSESFLDHFDGKSAEQSKLGILNHFRPLWWENIGKSAEQPKLVVLNHFGPLWWEKMGKSAGQPNWVFE